MKRLSSFWNFLSANLSTIWGIAEMSSEIQFFLGIKKICISSQFDLINV